VEAALADGWVRGGDLLGLQRRLLRLGKPPRRWKRPSWAASVGWEPAEVVIHARPLANPSATKSRFFAPDDSCVSVEELALQHYASPEGGRWAGLHSEGGVWGTLFGLLLWDVLFMGVPDVFRSPFQTAPLDLDSDAFYPARRSQLDAALTRIADGHAGGSVCVWQGGGGGGAARVSRAMPLCIHLTCCRVPPTSAHAHLYRRHPV
jgi:Fanconi-associated nuclease 1